MDKLLKKIIICISLFITPIFINATEIDGYALAGWKFSTISMSYKWGSNLASGTSTIKTAFITATDDWNKASNVKYAYHYNASSTCNSWYEASESLFGRTTTYHSSGIVKRFDALVNSGNTKLTGNVPRSVACHELGHPLGLDDLTTGSALMSHARNRQNIYKPQTDDINGIKAIYPEWY